MSAAERALQLRLSPKEGRILVQSLANCIATCRARAEKPDAPCEDCDEARRLLSRLEQSLRP